MPRGPHVDQNGDLRLGLLLKFILNGGLVAMLSAVVALGLLFYRVEILESGLDLSRRRLSRTERNQVVIDRNTREMEATMKQANLQLLVIADKLGVRRVERPKARPSELEAYAE